ncbi:ABC transporter permease [Pinibacter aurantiacus]|uniref:ABC transporter permease n=1 Tax=Pinibacter aurantiacus TaxID=2851599 RepID=A0A9E2W4A7_9BACT|nr:ABC transporter permease [Pinibacter aurantiacus]MBV4359505.1 ABC transporter permease [Pinibacter aurantiacus]
MFKNFFKVAFRNLLKRKGFTIINISGLAIGMASAILILLWVQNEVSRDRFHEKGDRIYRAYNKSIFDNKLQCWSTTPKILAPTIQKDYPEVEEVTRVHWGANLLFSLGDKRLNVRGTMVDSGFLHMFSLPLVKGNPDKALSNTYSIIVTEKLAKKLFSDEDPMNKVVKIDNRDNFTVTAVMKDLPNNTMFDFEYLLPWSYMKARDWDDDNWDNNSTMTFVMLKQNASITAFNNKIKNITYDHLKGREKIEVFMYPLEDQYLYNRFENGKPAGGRITTIRVFTTIAMLILLIACINFMNLSTARSEKRAKEVGIRKVVGAMKSSLITQFLGESVLIALIAAVIAIVLVQLALPSYNLLVKKNLRLEFGNPYFWLAGLGFVLFTGLIAGSYPAFFLSSFRPVAVLKGTFRKVSALITPRKVLVVAQFTFAIALIICTIIIQHQINYAQQRETGYDRTNLAYVFLCGDMEKNMQLIKNDLISQGIATNISKTSAPITESWSDSWGFEWPGKDPNDKTDFYRFCSDGNLVKTTGMKIIQGRDIDLINYPTDSTALVLNESAVKAMNLKNPIGTPIKDNGIDWHVVGVVQDFILQNPYEPMRPMVVEGPKGWFNVVHIKFNEANGMQKNIAETEKIFKRYNPEYPFEYKFVNEEYAQKFADEETTATLARLFSALTIFISCLGLFGLATYMAENRIKEIGVRKVLGASVANITALLSRDFLRLVIVAIVIATPIAWWAMHNWLQHYTYRVPISWFTFIVAGVLAIVIALATVSYQAIKAAVANPVKSLRTE